MNYLEMKHLPLGQCGKMLFPMASASRRQCQNDAMFTVDLDDFGQPEPDQIPFVGLCLAHGIQVAVQKLAESIIKKHPQFLSQKEIDKMLEIEDNPTYVVKLAEAQNGKVRVCYYQGQMFWDEIKPV